MKKVFMILIICLISVMAVQAQSAAPQKPASETGSQVALPSADQLVAKYVEALGGKAALTKLTSRSAKGTFELSAVNIKAPAEILAKAPNSFVLSIELPGFGKIQQGYDGSKGWSQDPQTGLRDISGPELDSLKRQAEFSQALKFQEIYPNLKVTGIEKVGDKEAFIAESTPGDGNPIKFYFDAKSGLMLRSDFTLESPGGKVNFKTFFEDYRDVEGVKMPFVTRQELPQTNIIITLTEVKNNVEIDNGKFAKPTAQ